MPAASETSGKKRSPLKKVLIGIGIFFLVIAVGLGVMLLVTEGQRREDRNLETADVDFSKVSDGTYRGNYEGWNKFDVLVTVTGGKVTDIKIADDSVNPASDVTDSIIERIVSGQSLDLDAVSGATVTTNGLLKAVERALVEQGVE
jgi:fumarate reductase flavoprotein subunit